MNSTLINTYPESKNETVEFQITDDGINMSGATHDSIEVPGYGGTKGISYEMNVSQLGAGTYDYELRHDDQTLERNFTIQNRPEDSSTVGDLLVEDIDPSATYLETGEDFEVEVQLYNAGEEATPGVSLGLTDGNLSDSDDDVTIPGGTRKNVTVELDGDDVADGLETRAEHEYNVTVEDDGEEDNQHFTGEFILKEEGDGDVTFFDDSYDFETDDEDTLVVNSTLINTNGTNATDQVVEFQITDDAVNMTDSIPTDPDGAAIDVPGHGTKDISYQVNVSQLRAGTYDYVLSHDGVELERNFTIENRPEESSTVGDVRVEDIDPSATYLETGEDFEVEVQLYNTAGEEATPAVSLDLIDDALSDTDDVAIPGGTRKNVTVDLDGDDVADELETRAKHKYNVTVANDGDDQSFPGSFAVLESGTSLQIDDHETTTAGEDWRWINATLANHGMEQGSDIPTLTVYDDETDEEVGSIDTGEPVEIDRANEVQIPFGFDRSELGGAYRYEVSYGEDTVEGYFAEGEADTGDGNVSITEPGNGTVSVLGTEVSAYSEGGCLFDCWPAQKSWAPTTVSTVLEIDGEETVVPFENTAADESNYENETNLNTFDTQDDVYTYDWSQVSDESATLTVSSSYWSVQRGEVVNTRDGIEDIQPGRDILDENPAGTVNANSGTNKEAVRVLKDGDDVPNPQTSGEDQRSAEEILNQGAADRIDDDGTLDLGPYEAVFLFELTQDSYDGMWNDSDESDGDPDYNDVIALVSFNPDEPDDVTFDVDDHSLSIGPTPNDPEETNDSGEQNVDIEPIDGSGEGSGPTSPDPQSPDPGNPSGADGVYVEVDPIEGPGAESEPASPDPGSLDPGSPSNPDQIDVDVGGVVIG